MVARAPAPRRNRDGSSFNLRSLLRLALWGAAAAASLGAVVFVAYTNVGSQRLIAAMAGGQPSSAQLAARTAETENETRRLTEAVQSLATDRERLLTRIASLERNLQEITGSIQRPAAAMPTASSPPGPPRDTQPQAVEIATPSPAVEARAPDTTNQPGVPASGNHVAALSAGDEQPINERGPLEFAVDVGSAANFDGLRLLWNSVYGTNPALFDGLHPLVAVRENRRTRSAELRLLVGPFGDTKAATRVCSVLSGMRRPCQPSAFEGQQFSLTTDPETRSAAPPTRRAPSTTSPKTGRQNPQQKSPAD
jgi:hypothetical protein